MEVTDAHWFRLAMDYFQEYKQEIYDAQDEKTQSQSKKRR